MTHLLQRLSGYFPALLALALPTLFLTFDSDSFILPRASIVVAGACLGIGLTLIVSNGPSLGAIRWPLLAGAAAAVLAFAFSIWPPLSFVGSYTRYESLPIRLSYLGLLATSVWLLRTQRQREWVVLAFVVGTSWAALWAVQQWVTHVPFRPDGNLGNANLLAGLIAMAAPLAVNRGLRAGVFAGAWAAALVAMFAGILVTTSRSGGLGAYAGVLLLGVLAVRGRWVVAAAAVWVAAVAAAMIVIQISPLHGLNNDPFGLRLHLWQDGARLVMSRPLTGWGEDTTGLVFGRFLSGDYASLVTFDRIHSGPLDIAATQGLVGLAALAWVLGVVFAAAWRRRHEAGAAGLTAALVGYSLWVVFNFDWAPVTGPFWLLTGTLWSAVSPPVPGPAREARQGQRADARPADQVPRDMRRGKVLRSLVASSLVVPAVGLGVLPVIADAYYVRGHPDVAVRLDPLQAQYHWAVGTLAELWRAADLGETEPGMYVQLGDLELQAGNRVQARAAYQRALTIDPFYGPAQQRLNSLGAS